MQVLIAGGGIAALEALAGLRALAGERVQTTLLAPVDSFSYRPLSTAAPFTSLEARTFSLAELASGAGARFVHDGLVHVDASAGRVLTHDGEFLSYDALLLAVGARAAHPPRPGIMWTRSSQGSMALAELLRELEGGEVRSVAFIVPPGAAWPVDAYELSFVARLAAERAGGETRVLLVTAEQAPVEALGPAASEAVAHELAGAGVELVTGVNEAESPLGVERAVCLPVAHGPAISGMAHNAGGFIPVDGHGRTADGPRIYAAGDATAVALKHSTLSSSQATTAAYAIAAEAGAKIVPIPWSPVLYGMLTLPPRFPGARGSPWLEDGEPMTHCLWWPPGHVAGRHLAPYLAKLDTRVRTGLDWHPRGLPVAVPVSHDTPSGAAVPAGAPPEELRHDALTRQLMAIRRDGREGKRLGLELERRLADFERHEQAVARRLETAGYLRHAE